MIVRKFAIADVSFERFPGQDGDVFAGNLFGEENPNLARMGGGLDS